MWINFWNCLKLRCAVESLCLFSSWCMWCVFTQELEISRERLILQIRAAVTGKDRWLQRIARIHMSRATWHSQHEQATVRRSKNKASYKYLFCHFRAKGNTSDYSPQITVRLFSVTKGVLTAQGETVVTSLNIMGYNAHLLHILIFCLFFTVT